MTRNIMNVMREVDNQVYGPGRFEVACDTVIENGAAAALAGCISLGSVAGLAGPASAGEVVRGDASHFVVKAQPGDTLWALQRTYGGQVSRIAADSGMPDPDKLKPGQTLNIQFGNTQAANAASGGMHKVARGETAGQIARHLGTSVGGLSEAYKITDLDNIKAGEVLVVVRDGRASKVVVHEGDTLEAIAKARSVSPGSIRRLRPLANPNLIHTNETLLADVASPANTAVKPVVTQGVIEKANAEVQPVTPQVVVPEAPVVVNPTPEVAPASATASPAVAPAAQDKAAEKPLMPTDLPTLVGRFQADPRIAIDQSPHDRVRQSIVDSQDGLTFRGDVGNKQNVEVSPAVYQLVLELVDKLDVKITITCVTTGHDGKSFHDQGRAIDLQLGSKEDYQTVFQYLYENRERLGLDELIYGGDLPGGTSNLDKGENHSYSSDVIEHHTSHVHVGFKSKNPIEQPDNVTAANDAVAQPNGGNPINVPAIAAVVGVVVNPEAQAPVATHEATKQPSILDGLSEQYKQTMAQRPTLAYALSNFDSNHGQGGGPQMSREDIARIAYSVGFRGDDLVIAVALGYGAEAKGTPFVINTAAERDFGPNTYAVGPWQILFTPKYSNEAWRDGEANLDPITNAHNAFNLKTQRGWKQWESFTTNAYLKHMAEARVTVEALAVEGWK